MHNLQTVHFAHYDSVYREFNRALLQCETFEAPTWEPVGRDCKADTVKPTLEKLRFDDAEVAGIHR